MKIETAEAVKRAADVLGVDVRIDEAYSGRGMFGRTTAALVGYRNDIETAKVYAAYQIGTDRNGDAIDAFMDDIDWKWDSLGRKEVAC